MAEHAVRDGGGSERVPGTGERTQEPETRVPGGTRLVRVTVNLPEPDVRDLRQWAAEDGVSVTQALREAIAEKRFYRTERIAGGKVLIERDNEVREVDYTH